MSFIVIEGLDGSGKSTQSKMLQDFFTDKKINFDFIHFPRLETPFYGEMIARFLRGDFGGLNEVDPYLVSLLYACDRNNAKTLINKWKKEKKLVLVDRYVYSNIAYQCAKLKENDEKEKLRNWILNLEFNVNKIPKPDVNIFIDVPFSFVKDNLQKSREGNDRDYLLGKEDIHEKDLDFQENVRLEYLRAIKNKNEVFKVDATDKNGRMLEKNEVFFKIITIIESKIQF